MIAVLFWTLWEKRKLSNILSPRTWFPKDTQKAMLSCYDDFKIWKYFSHVILLFLARYRFRLQPFFQCKNYCLFKMNLILNKIANLMQKGGAGKCSGNRTGYLIVPRVEKTCYHKIDTQCDYISLVYLGNQFKRNPFISMLLSCFFS